MDKRRWRREKNRVVLFVKLTEEVGEVAETLLGGTAKSALKEIDHVIFLAERLREELKKNATAGRRQVPTVQAGVARAD